MVSTEARAKTAPRIHRRYGLVFILDTDTNDNGFLALSLHKFVKSDFSEARESLVHIRVVPVVVYSRDKGRNVATSNSVLSETMPSTP
jgi:hypothetical protein